MHKLVLLRHGQSSWNLENRFTGWTDVDLTELGVREARAAGRLFKEGGFEFDRVYSSVLRRAIRTAWLVLDEMDRMWLPMTCDWRLNERHYGSLQGLDKAETAAKFGDAQVLVWRRSYDVPPPVLEKDDPRFPGHDLRYQHLTNRELPLTENLAETMARVMPFWTEKIMGALHRNQKVIVCAHGNSLRALVQYIDHLSDEEVTNLDIPTGVPLVYELDDNLDRIQHYYL